MPERFLSRLCVVPGAPPLDMARALLRGVLSLPQFMQERLAERLGFGTSLIQALGQIYERWEGKGLPHGRKSEAVAPAVLLVTLAQDVITYQRLGDLDAAVQMVRMRTGGAYDPRHADHCCAHATTLMQGLDNEPSWDLVLGCEPGKRHALTESQLDTACQALAATTTSPGPADRARAGGAAPDRPWSLNQADRPAAHDLA